MEMNYARSKVDVTVKMVELVVLYFFPNRQLKSRIPFDGF